MSHLRACFFLSALAFVPSLLSAPDIQTLDTPRTFPEITSEAQWSERSQAIREQILVDGGLWPMPEKTPLHAKVFGKIERDGYSVEKVYFQSYPGFYVGGNLYRPVGKGSGPFPAILNVHGHWEHGRLEDTDLCSNPARCINFAKQGMIALAIDMVGYNDTHFPETPHNASFYILHHEFASNNPVDMLWSVSLMGLQLWDSVRALDFLESLPDVDKTRIACTGASGGGTQTFMLGAIDNRLAAQAPVVMVSHTMQGGCLCENMPGLRIRYSNMEIAAAAAPRPQILVSDTQDWTKTTMTMEGPAIEGIYKLFGASDNLRYVQYDFPHNYNQTSREAVYQWLDRWLLHQPDQPVREMAFHKENDSDLRVFPDGTLPPDAVTQADLTKYLIATHQEELQALNPVNKRALAKYRTVMDPAWRQTLQLDWPPGPLETSVEFPLQEEGYVSERIKIVRHDEGKAIGATRFTPVTASHSHEPTIVILADTDEAKPLINNHTTPGTLAKQFLTEGFAVVVPYSPIPLSDGKMADPNQATLLYTTYNRTLLQERVDKLVSICQSVRELYTNNCRVILCGGSSPSLAGLSVSLAAPAADAVIVNCCQTDTSDDQTLLTPDLFCPGIRNIDTFEGALVLAAPHPLLLHNVANGFSTAHVRSTYKTLHMEKRLQIESQPIKDNEIVSWVASLHFPEK